MSKTYFIFVNDHSGSMAGPKAKAAQADYNATIEAVKNSASREMEDVVVSVVAIGIEGHHAGWYGIKRQVVLSNPHVLKPITNWPTPGNTPLWDAIAYAIELGESFPDANEPDVSFVVQVTTDGHDQRSTRYSDRTLAPLIAQVQNTGRWTFAMRVPKNSYSYLANLGIPRENVYEWENSAEGLVKAQAATTQAVDSFLRSKAAGATSSSVFYTSTAQVNTAALTDISKEVALYVVGDKTSDSDGMQIKDFILNRRQQYLIGAAFYQLVKTEPRVQPGKLILIREKATGKVYAGNEARLMIGLDTVNNARLHPNHGGGGYDIFIQSESVNRKLPIGTGVLYWAVKGRPMTQADLDKYTKPAAPAVVQLPDAPATGRPTPSPIPKTPKSSGDSVDGKPVKFFATREDARQFGRTLNPVKFVQDVNDYRARGSNVEYASNVVYRWFIFL